MLLQPFFIFFVVVVVVQGQYKESKEERIAVLLNRHCRAIMNIYT